MPPRLGHKKSRNGCTACKKRRVKCDEQRPCGACVRYGWPCSLMNATSPAASAGPGNSASSAQSPEPAEFSLTDPSTSTLPSPQDDPADVRTSNWLQDLELLHHYCTIVWRTMTHKKHGDEMWYITIPRLACRSEFLMHGLLAVSALHLAHFEPSRRRHYSFVSTYHQNLAISGFRDALPHVTQDNADCISVASMMIATFAFASSSLKSLDPQEEFTLNDAVEILILMRGIEETLSAGRTREWVREGPIGALLQWPAELEGPPDTSQEIFHSHLAEVRQLLARSAKEIAPETAVALEEGLKVLEVAYSLCLRPRPVLNTGLIMWWPNMVSMSFLGLIQEQNPIALIVFALFCAMMHFHEERWVWERWPAQVVRQIKQNLDPEWHKWIDWCADVIERNLKYQDAESTTPA